MTGPIWAETVLNAARNIRAVVFGDICLDAYWMIEAGQPPSSLETGLPIHSIRAQRYSLGGAGNVVSNLAALGVGSVAVVGAVGDDLFGYEVRRLLSKINADIKNLQTLDHPWQTMTYAKPYLNDAELNRLDFGSFNQSSSSSTDAMLSALSKSAVHADAVIINQQFASGPRTVETVERINAIIADHPKTKFIVDARDTAGLFKGAVLKLNAHEALRLLGTPVSLETPISLADAWASARQLFDKTGQPVFVTRGEHGMLAADASGVSEVPGILTTSRTDPVGAGDTVVAALAAVLGSGGDVQTAARLANIAAYITVGKLQQTGTATPDEILAVSADTDFIYHPELAEDARGAKFHPSTEIEIIHPLPADIHIRHAIFDHDGTLSTLREGWERIMQPMMEQAVLGPRYHDADPALFRKVQEAVRTSIDKTTGIQTLVQMQGLVQLVRQYRFVPTDQVLDHHGYKKIYNDRLLEMIAERLAKLHRGELAPVDFQIKNADALLRRLHKQGIKLYLASGTDETDVIAEAAAMGYADLFEGRIYGAVGDVRVEAKKVVLERIIRENKLAGHEFVVFGDGPVEMREARKRDGIAVGICSDEVRRFGHNPSKRARLIRGGATVLVPDFSQIEQLLGLLKLA